MKVAAEKAKDQMDSYTTSVITPNYGGGRGWHKYGADAFEAAVKAGRVDVGDKKGDNLMKKSEKKR